MTAEKPALSVQPLLRADARFRWMAFSAAMLIVVLFAGMFISLAVGAWPALSKFGFGFFTSSDWDPVRAEFGIAAPIFGTIVTSALAVLMATPVGIAIAVFLTEICPRAFRRPIGIAIELLAGIPSIIYGIWGLFVFAPFFQRTIQPFLINLFDGVPVLSGIFAGPPYGVGVFTASLILAIMILPLIAAITRDVFETVPAVLKESAYGLGCTVEETTRKVVLPYARAGVAGGVMLALGRALGETMAVTFVIGNAHRLSTSLFAPGVTISSAIANEFTEAVDEIYRSSLLAAGFFLMFITFLVLAAAQLMLNRLERKSGGK